jgi:hypothetical protein
MKKFITKLVLFSLPFIIAYTAIALFNYTVDLACLFSRTQVLERITDSLLSGKIIAGRPVFNFRVYNKIVIDKINPTPNIIALGSSTTMSLRASCLGLEEGSFFNHSVPSGGLNDFIAFLGCYKKKGAFPKTILIGIDAHLFYERITTNKKWKLIARAYYYLLSYMQEDVAKIVLWYELAKAKGFKIKWLLSSNYAFSNYKHLIQRRKKGFDYKVVKNTSIDDYLLVPDGSLYRPFRIRFQDDATTQKKVQHFVLKKGTIKRYKQISLQKTFTSLIDYILKNDTQIVFFLPPYHPGYYQRFKKERLCIVDKIEAMLRSFAQSRKIPVVGSYDPSSLNLSSRDFIDEVHAHDNVVEKIFKEYREVTRK